MHVVPTIDLLGRCAFPVASLIVWRHRRSWLRVIVEKPFGKDLESSEELAAELARWYPEEQVYTKGTWKDSVHPPCPPCNLPVTPER